MVVQGWQAARLKYPMSLEGQKIEEKIKTPDGGDIGQGGLITDGPGEGAFLRCSLDDRARFECS